MLTGTRLEEETPLRRRAFTATSRGKARHTATAAQPRAIGDWVVTLTVYKRSANVLSDMYQMGREQLRQADRRRGTIMIRASLSSSGLRHKDRDGLILAATGFRK